MLDGRQPEGLELSALVKTFAAEWREQRAAWAC
jgi:hypothetical protein